MVGKNVVGTTLGNAVVGTDDFVGEEVGTSFDIHSPHATGHASEAGRVSRPSPVILHRMSGIIPI